MRHTTLIKLGILLVLLAWGVSPVQATPIPLIDGDGDDSGWTVESGGATLDLMSSDIIDVNLAAKTVTITVAKDFGPYEVLSGEIIFPVGTLTFTEVNANTDLIDKIIIESETIVNNTGLAWDSFSWQIMGTGVAEFNKPESSDWLLGPLFSTWSFETDHQLLASDGTVANGATFAPGGGLVIDIHPDASDDPLAFSLKQNVTPEPATMAVLFVGGVLIVSRHFRKR